MMKSSTLKRVQQKEKEELEKINLGLGKWVKKKKETGKINRRKFKIN